MLVNFDRFTFNLETMMSFDIFVMQAFGGVSLFTVLALMALGLAIVFGLMGVINMAHGEIMALGAYTTYLTSLLFQSYLPDFAGFYFPIGVVLAFGVTFLFGLLLERGMIRFLYARPLDTMLSTWGLSLILQQLFRQVFGAIDVNVPTVSWLQGAWHVSDTIQLPLSRIFILFLTLGVAAGLYFFLFRSHWGLRIRAVMQNRTMAGAAGINTANVDAVTFALGCGLAGIAGAALTMLAATGPSTGQQYIVDTFVVVVFGGVQSLLGTFMSAFMIGQMQSMLEYALSGSMAKVLILSLVIVVLYFRPNGLFSIKVRR